MAGGRAVWTEVSGWLRLMANNVRCHSVNKIGVAECKCQAFAPLIFSCVGYCQLPSRCKHTYSPPIPMQCIDFIREKIAEKEELPSCQDKKEGNGHFIQGLIIGRRSLGRNLSFADVAVTQSAARNNETNDSNDVSINIIFTRQSFFGPKDNTDTLNEPFPTQKTSLPYGASIIAQLGHCQKVKSKITGLIEDVWEVTRWKITEHPKELAKDMASLMIINNDEQQNNEVGEQSSSQQEESNNKHVIIGNGAMSCSDYLKVRKNASEMANKRKQQLLLDRKSDVVDIRCPTKDQGRRNNRAMKESNNTKSTIPEKNKLNNSMESEFNHGGKQAKAKRAKIFASWILETFFGIPMSAESMMGSIQHDRLDNFCQPCQSSNDDAPAKEHIPQQMHVFDVAGGKGHLSLELILHQTLATVMAPVIISRCTIVDPMVRKSDARHRQAKLRKAESRLRKQQNHDGVVGTIDHIATYFNRDSFTEIYNQTIPNLDLKEESRPIIPTTTLLLGLHPDECTEDILDAALEHDLSVAIIPCCLFTSLFPSRTIKRSSNGVDKEVPVTDYDDFIQYLLDKDESLQLHTLPFEGKNKVIYRKIKSG